MKSGRHRDSSQAGQHSQEWPAGKGRRGPDCRIVNDGTTLIKAVSKDLRSRTQDHCGHEALAEASVASMALARAASKSGIARWLPYVDK